MSDRSGHAALPLAVFRVALALAALVLASSGASALGYDVDIDQSQSRLILTVFGGDYSGDMDGTLHFDAFPDLTDGASAEITDFDATVEDIEMGLAALRDMTVTSNPAIPSWGMISDPLVGDDHVYIFQQLYLVVDAVYDPLIGGDEPIHSETELCLGDLTFCVEPNGLADLDTATFWFEVLANGVIPADENPLGVDIPFQVIVKGQGMQDATGVAEAEFGPPARDLRVWPNPALATVSFSLGAQDAEPLRVEIFDVAGRHITTLSGGADSEQLVWDRRDLRGERVGAGVYLARYRQGDRAGSGKVLLIH